MLIWRTVSFSPPLLPIFCVFVALPSILSFVTKSNRPLFTSMSSIGRGKYVPAASKTGGTEASDDEDKDGDDEIAVKPYRNRSLSWTHRYRKLNPYEKARGRVISFGHRSKADWDEAVASGQLGQYVPNYPDEMYAPEWSNWEEWLGLMRSYNDTQYLSTKILRLKSLDDYLIFVKSYAKRAEGLRIPVRPDLYYKDEWIDEATFFGR